MSTPAPSLATRHSDLTQRVILEAGVELLEQASVAELSVRAVAKRAGISERTIFRYFATREELLDALAREVARRLNLPPHPRNVEELLAFPEAAYTSFEAASALTKAALHSELYHRIRGTEAEQRGEAIRAVIDRAAPTRSAQERKLATANIRYYLIASTWHYYRVYFGLSLAESIECARMAITQTLQQLGVRVPGRPKGQRQSK